MFESFSKGKFLQTIIIAIVIGIEIQQIKNKEYKEVVTKWFMSANDMIFSYVRIIIKFSPLSILFLLADTFGLYEFSIFTPDIEMLNPCFPQN